jgi:hypothetical protein
VNWDGTHYTFSKGLQAESVGVLWKEYEKGQHSLSQETVGKAAGSVAQRFELRKVFRARKQGGGYEPHPAWGTMILHSTKGCFQLAPLARIPTAPM